MPMTIFHQFMTSSRAALVAALVMAIVSALPPAKQASRSLPLFRRYVATPNIVALGVSTVLGPLLRHVPRESKNRQNVKAVVLWWWWYLVGLAAAKPWTAALSVRPTVVGAGTDGSPFTIRDNGRQGYLRGLDVRFSDGTERSRGARKDQFSELALEEDEVIRSMTLWSTPLGRFSSLFSRGGRVARIDLTTNRRSWGYGVENTAKLSAKAVDVGSGVLIGFQGRAGEDLGQLAPLFLRKLSRSVVHNVAYDLPAGSEGLRLLVLREGTAVWNGTDYSWTFSGTEARGTETTFNVGSSSGLSVSTSFAVSLPQIGLSGIGVGWTAGSTMNYEKKNI
ncbi:hypothetical protein VTJ83DRAFT_4422 [Remersonia thermophila]|uniref:Jacalin-type lectin domain-containing protein n=1 Tax=Remersonia thermophila TaxID=72144 RepID=A0ABR4D9V2_9PEZI